MGREGVGSLELAVQLLLEARAKQEQSETISSNLTLSSPRSFSLRRGPYSTSVRCDEMVWSFSHCCIIS